MWWLEKCKTIVLWQHHLFGHVSHKWSMVCHFSYISFILTRFIIVEKWALGRCAMYNRTLNREQELILKTKSWPITISSQFSEARSAVVQVHMACQKYFFRWKDYKELNFLNQVEEKPGPPLLLPLSHWKDNLAEGRGWSFKTNRYLCFGPFTLAILTYPRWLLSQEKIQLVSQLLVIPLPKRREKEERNLGRLGKDTLAVLWK